MSGITGGPAVAPAAGVDARPSRKRGPVLIAAAVVLVLVVAAVITWQLWPSQERVGVTYERGLAYSAPTAPEERPQERWSIDAPGDFPFAAGEERVAFVGESTVTAVSADDGSLIWESELPPELTTSNPRWSESEGSLLYSAGNPAMGWVSHQNGEVEWVREGYLLDVDPDERVALVQTDPDGEVFVVDLDTGEALWNRILAFPVITGERVYAIDGEDLVALGTADGEEHWSVPAPGAEAIAAHGVVAAHSHEGVRVYDADGTEVYSRDGRPDQVMRVGPEQVILGMEESLVLLEEEGEVARRDVSAETAQGGRFGGVEIGGKWMITATIDGEPALLDTGLQAVLEERVEAIDGGFYQRSEAGLAYFAEPGADPVWELDVSVDAFIDGGVLVLDNGQATYFD